ncbi:MAG: HAMP domain-containing histidine kinase [Clostridia bacterium]|nr:HAMP domain-containing histidine kinase [Clostridia bacterium]
MIYKLQRRFIIICTVSVLLVVSLVFGVFFMLNISSMNRNIDILADRVSEGGGKFPSGVNEGQRPDKFPMRNDEEFDFITPETPFSTRYFTVFFEESGDVVKTNTESIYSITEEKAIEYARKVLNTKNERGWISNYRYKVYSTETGDAVVFIDGSMNRTSMMQSTAIAGSVLVGCSALVLILIFLLSKKAVKPIAESYEKQKQFITDANHELKTPLTLILANLDIAESELGKNEWLNDIRSEGYRMTDLVNQLVTLSRMDEEGNSPVLSKLYFGRLVADAVAEFVPLIESRGKGITFNIDRDILCVGDETLLKRLIGILMDNAVKYCDDEGEITVTLRRGRRTVLTVENTYVDVDFLELNKLFDRFYRADKARTFKGGYGIGLSMAKAIVEKHKGEISVYKKDHSIIGFKVIFNQ